MSHLPISITNVKNRTSLNAQWGRDTHNELSEPAPLGHSPWPQVLWGGLKIGSYGGWIPPGIELTFASLPCGGTLAMHLLNHLVQHNWEKQPQNIPECLLGDCIKKNNNTSVSRQNLPQQSQASGPFWHNSLPFCLAPISWIPTPPTQTPPLWPQHPVLPTIYSVFSLVIFPTKP